jgi:microcompartment protein CcmK/EutM
VIAADATAQAGPGELVFMVASREGAGPAETFVPVDLAITGIVDEVEVERRARRSSPRPTGAPPTRTTRPCTSARSSARWWPPSRSTIWTAASCCWWTSSTWGEETGSYDIAVDVVQAGPGDTVLVIDRGNGARQILGLNPGAVRAVVCGVVGWWR